MAKSKKIAQTPFVSLPVGDAPVAPIVDVAVAPVADVVLSAASDSAESLVANLEVCVNTMLADSVEIPDPADDPAPVADPIVADSAEIVADSADSAPVGDAPADSAESAPAAPVADSAPAAPAQPSMVALSIHVADPANRLSLLTPKAQVACQAWIKSVGDVFNIATSRLAEWGRDIDNILTIEMLATEGWNGASFDSTIGKITDDFMAANPESQAKPRTADFWKTGRFLGHCTTLGIVNAEQLSYRRIVNTLVPASMDMLKSTAGSALKDGWADWLKAVIPMLNNGTMNDATLTASVQAQREGLHKLDPKKYPKAPIVKGAAPAAPAASSATSTAPAASSTAKTAPAAPAPTPAASSTAPAASTAPAKPAPAPAPAPTPAASAIAPFNLETFVSGMTGETAKQLGELLASKASDEVIAAIYKAMVPRVQVMKDARAAKKAG